MQGLLRKTTTNSYKMNPDNFSVNFADSRQQQADYYTLYVQNSGADSKALIGMRNYDGLWYTFNNSSLYVMVRDPQDRKNQKRFSHDADYDGKPVPPRTSSNSGTYGQPIDINSLMPAPIGNTGSSSQKQNSSRTYNNYGNNSYNNSGNNGIEQTITRAIKGIIPNTNTNYRRY